MVLNRFEIKFENATKTYHPGEIVKGKVIFSCSQEESAKGLYVEWGGKASVNWMKQSTSRCGTGYGYGGYGHSHYHNVTINYNTDHYTGNEKYLDNYFYAFGDGIEDITIFPGDYEYPFEFLLPMGIACSFDCPQGWIRYGVHATMRNTNGKNEDIGSNFFVLALLDLNAVPKAAEPAVVQYSKMIGGCCCVSGPVGFVLRLPKTGYAPGDEVVIEAEIENSSRNEVNAIKVILVQSFTFHAGGQTKRDDQIIGERTRGGLPPHSKDIWHEAVFNIPPNAPPSGLGGCRIINLEYHLDIEMFCSGTCGDGTNPAVSVPVLIGTVPFKTAPSSVSHHDRSGHKHHHGSPSKANTGQAAGRHSRSQSASTGVRAKTK